MEWQERALRVVDLVPELDYVSRFYEKMLSPLRLFPATLKSDGQPEEIKTGTPVDVLKRIRDPGGGQSQILGSYGRLMLITGEGNLFGYHLNTEDERWRFVWNAELDVERDKDNSIRKITWSPGSSTEKQEFTSDEAVLYKFWRPHPRRSGEATAPMRAIVEGDVAEELIALTRSVLSTATSRATKGILLIAQEIAPPLEEGENPVETSWLTMISEHFEAQINNAGSPAAAAPFLMDPPMELIEGVKHIDTHKTEHDYLEKELRKEAVERIARGIDFPAEALLGIGQTNHWAAMQILMDMWRSHGAPLARGFCADLTSAYYQPALREEGVENWREIVVAYDASEVTVKPDRSDDAAMALRLMAIGPSGYRKMLGISDDFAPTAAELELMRGPRPTQQPQRDPSGDGPEAPGPEGDSGRRTRATASADRRMGTVELALMRCRELAGIRIKQKAQRHFPDQMAFILDLPFADMPASLGQEMVKEMGLGNTLALVSGGADNLRSLLGHVWGYGPEQADIFASLVEAHAAHTLYQPGFPELDGHLTLFVNGMDLEAAA